ncbi:DMT family transporter [Pseudomonas sp. p1(2021b)]|uniref:DMT family transporter n=1 Tax=Pseudomonas sp. p1(2021b) TaxID=2874628 RepID=UPI001CCA0A17|nr:DMT family transporter [Pseudomonas sp. p1(2021b)]UBM23528.1 DMT family transporter [Pseudomonas sp. p1(2021b)]
MSASTPLSGVNQPLRGIALVVVATFLFASHDALSKFLGGLYPIIMVVWARYLVHTLLMAGIFLPKAGVAVLRTRRPVLQTLRALSLLSTSLLFTTGLQYLPLAEATSVNFLAPVLVTALSVPLLKERVSVGQWVAVVMGFIGVLVVVHPGGAMFTPAILFPFGSALGFCFYQLLTRKLAVYDSPTTSNFFAGLCNTLILSVLVPFFWHAPQWNHVVLMLALGGCGMTAHLLLTQAFRLAAPALLAPFSYCQIVFAGLLGLLIFGQVPDIASLVGIAIICLSGLGAAWMQRGK